ncbi:MAG TPA: glycosyltransferase family 4 protein [Chitinophaga sp.]
MKPKQPHLIFIGHEGSFSGAPILLLNLLRLVQDEVRVTLVVRADGPFVKEYEQYFPVLVLKPAHYGQGAALHRLKKIAGHRLRMARLLAKTFTADLIFSNTIVNGKLLKTLAICKKPVVTYVHELDEVIKAYLPTGDASLTLQYSRRIAYPSLKVKQALQTICQVPDAQLHPLSYYFPVAPALLENRAERTAFATAFRQRFGLEGATMLVGGMGLASDRKGTDIFIATCAQVAQVMPGIKFCWIGAFWTAGEEALYKKMVQDNGLEAQLVFTGPLPHHYYNAAAFDLFFLSSREDPYPLVVLEAALMGVPTVCFKEGGGIPEFVGENGGWVVPSLTAGAAAQTILALYAQPEERRQKGQAALQKCLALHADPARVKAQFHAIIDPLLAL